MAADEFKVEMLEATVAAHVKGDQNGDDLRIRKAVGLVAVAFPVRFFQSVVFKTCRNRLPGNKFP